MLPHDTCQPSDNLSAHLIGDKVRIREGKDQGARGRIETINSDFLGVRLDSGAVVLVNNGRITNFSLAARKAWRSMPKRSGRPRSDTREKRMVSIRIAGEVWDRLGEAVEAGLIQSREQAVNEWLQLHLEELFSSYDRGQQYKVQGDKND